MTNNLINADITPSLPIAIGMRNPAPAGVMVLRILVFDNYDSYTNNIVHMVEKITQEKVDV